jgi:hypothetical protein
MCTRCRRPRSVCYCAALPHLDTTTRVVILQHPRERDMPIGTARGKPVLPRAQRVGVDWATRRSRRARASGATADPLYPPGARHPARATGGSVTLVVVDGTWSQARRSRDNPDLQGCRAMPRHPGTMRCRIREPRSGIARRSRRSCVLACSRAKRSVPRSSVR